MFEEAKMTLDDLKNEFGTSYKFSMRTGMSHVNWVHWFNRYGYIPIESQRKIELITNGVLKASLDDLPIKER